MLLSTRDLARIRKLEFIHSIGLIPVLRMKSVGDQGNSGGQETCENGGGDGGGCGIELNDEETEVNSTETTEPEDSEDDEDFTSGSRNHGSDLEHNQVTHNRVAVQRKSYEELFEENERMRQLLDANTTQIAELKRLQDVITDENNLLSLELQEVQKTAKEQKIKLETDLQRNIRVKEFLHGRVEKFKGATRELNDTLLYLIRQINGSTRGTNSDQGSSVESSMVPFLPRQRLSTSSAGSSSSSSSSEPSSELRIVLRRLDKTSSYKVSPQKLPPTNFGQITSRETVDESQIPTPRRSQRQLTFTKQIDRCLASIPTLLSSYNPKTEGHKSEKEEKIKLCSPNLKNAKRAHEVDVSKEKDGFFCTCGVNVTTKLGLITHIRYFTYEGQFCCCVKGCGKRYFTTSSLRAHMKSKHGLLYTGREGCRKCGQTFLSRMQLYIHCKNVHNCGPLLAHLKNRNHTTSTSFSPSSPSSTTPRPKKVVIFKGNNGSLQFQHPNTHKGRVNVKNHKLYQMRHELDLSKSVEGVYCICGREFASKRNLRGHIKYFTYDIRGRKTS